VNFGVKFIFLRAGFFPTHSYLSARACDKVPRIEPFAAAMIR
jgi:hypothetical protein